MCNKEYKDIKPESIRIPTKQWRGGEGSKQTLKEKYSKAIKKILLEPAREAFCFFKTKTFLDSKSKATKKMFK